MNANMGFLSLLDGVATIAWCEILSTKKKSLVLLQPLDDRSHCLGSSGAGCPGACVCGHRYSHSLGSAPSILIKLKDVDLGSTLFAGNLDELDQTSQKDTY